MGLGIGPLELGVVLLVALLVFGPHRLPELTRTIGRTVAEFRRAVSQVSVDLTSDAMPRSPPQGTAPTTGARPQQPLSAPSQEPRS